MNTLLRHTHVSITHLLSRFKRQPGAGSDRNGPLDDSASLRAIEASVAFGVICLALPRAEAQLTNYTVLHSFGPAIQMGRFPADSLIEGGDGALYGTTRYGGNSNMGTVFRLGKNGGDYAVRHNFTGGSDGGHPAGPLFGGRDGLLYGVTDRGGAGSSGTVFNLSRDGADYAVVHAFGTPLGDTLHDPLGGIVESSDGALYGTTRWGGAWDKGTVYKLTKDGSGSAQTLLHTFRASPDDGAQPSAGVIEGKDTMLYGTTYLGGTSNFGIVFKLTKDGSNYTVLHNFAGGPDDGANSFAALLEGSDGALYGATSHGGSAGVGTVFKMTKDGREYSILHSFSGSNGDGSAPHTLIQGKDGSLYGTTQSGGSNDGGTLYRLARDGSSYTVLRSFPAFPGDGIQPYAALVEGSDGALYGTTSEGGTWGYEPLLSGYGTVFRLGHALSLNRHPDRVLIGLTGIPGYTYLLQRSMDLANWTTLSTNTMPDTLFLQYEDAAAPPGCAFYRLRVP